MEHSGIELPWVEKYRPQTIDEVISNHFIIKSLKMFMAQNTLPHMLFFGPSGSGKTSTIKCCARQIYGKHLPFMTLELNASNDRGIDVVRTPINNFIISGSHCFLPLDARNKFKLIILDEFDSMTIEAQGMLRRIIEKNSGTTRFCLICNDIDKVSSAIQSRCCSYRFIPLAPKDMEEKLSFIADNEEINSDEETIKAIVEISKGDMRNAINILQHASLVTNGSKIGRERIYRLSGVITPSTAVKIFKMLMRLHEGKIGLSDCVRSVQKVIDDNNITIPNLLDTVCRSVVRSEIERKLSIVSSLSLLELDDAKAVDSFIVVMNLCSLFVSD